LLRENPEYQLYCTGHSLGGALSSLFAFYAAADEDIKKHKTGPVRVFSVASPYAGDAQFLLAFQALEREKRLQHLRIANAEDVVTHMPRGVVYQYRHCGIKLQLNSSTGDSCKPLHEVYYTQKREVSVVFEDGKNLFNSVVTVAKYHSCTEYETRLKACEKELEKVTIDDLYNDKGIVSNILDPDYLSRKHLTTPLICW